MSNQNMFQIVNDFNVNFDKYFKDYIDSGGTIMPSWEMVENSISWYNENIMLIGINVLCPVNIIKENIQINCMKYKEKYESMKNALKLYKSLGGEFESIHKSYVELKNKLDNRKWTLNKLKNEIFY